MLNKKIDHTKENLQEALGVAEFFKELQKDGGIIDTMPDTGSTSEFIESITKLVRRYTGKSESDITKYEASLVLSGISVGVNIEKIDSDENLRMVLSLRKLMENYGKNEEE